MSKRKSSNRKQGFACNSETCRQARRNKLKASLYFIPRTIRKARLSSESRTTGIRQAWVNLKTGKKYSYVGRR